MKPIGVAAIVVENFTHNDTFLHKILQHHCKHRKRKLNET